MSCLSQLVRRLTVVDSPFAFLQIKTELSLRNAIALPHITLPSVSKTLYSIDEVSSIGEELRMVNSEVMKARDVQHVLTPPTVRVDDAFGH